MPKFIPLCKGKDLQDIAMSCRPKPNDECYSSTKYDGNYIQIAVDVDKQNVDFFTSGGKDFYVHQYAMDFLHFAETIGFVRITFEAEWVGDTVGYIGDREKSQGIITTWRTDFKHKIISRPLKNGKFKIFDYISSTIPFKTRVENLKAFAKVANDMFDSCIDIVQQDYMLFKDSEEYAKVLAKNKFEGAYVKLLNHVHTPGKRTNLAIKRKDRPTFDLLVIGFTYGDADGKYSDSIGSLVCVDSKQRRVSVGSGLNDADRIKPFEHFNGKVIEIEAERVTDTTYIQPVYKCIRYDKTSLDIN